MRGPRRARIARACSTEARRGLSAKTTPTKSAPFATATSTWTISRSPQILTSGGSHTKKLANLRAGIGSSGERFAHQYALDFAAAHPHDICSAAHATRGDEQDVVWDERPETLGSAEVLLKGMEVAIINP